MASFQLFAQHGSGHLGNANPAAKDRKTRKEREGARGRIMGNRGGELKRGWIVQTNGEKRLFLSGKSSSSLFSVKCKRNPAGLSIRNLSFIYLIFEDMIREDQQEKETRLCPHQKHVTEDSLQNKSFRLMQ